MGSFADNRAKAQKQGLLGSGDYLKLKEGANRMRLMTDCVPHPGEYQGRPNFKWLCYVIDKSDQKVKPFFMAHTIYKQIEALQGSEDYAFEDCPMPYDVTVMADGAGTKEVKYTVMPARKNTDVSEGELMQLEKLKPIEELSKALRKEKADEKAPEDEHDEYARPVTDEEMPF